MVAEIPTLVSLEDAELVAQAKAGGREAFSTLICRHHGTIWAIAYAKLRDRHAADDLAQEVLLVSLLHLQELADLSRYPLRMQNRFGRECVQQLVLVLPPGWAIADSGEAPAETHEIGANRVLVWQKHVPSGQEGYTMTVSLERVK